MSHLPGVLFFWKDLERPIDIILLQSDQSKSFNNIIKEDLFDCVVYTPQLSEEQTPQPNTGSFLLMNLAS
ncbi:hypothetical protein PHYBLDRAFT_148959 [Phycomyces blakesleeanus NRRL 1555(-)]|uniref:Uncharacterized protein n=1 Tax=Phycomyces blakesleeanus (strain ATCC 8743b / DSM 1359 / FGSC 10004 / NBRC 33097 / NRRL 1555) TaxID=763407 RepID=A0A163D9L7_PHYB8|nr:hypothetical protein PHYBLDRAFT_148959 [Phycomyces blakesleeanus NRRL 1555(-)]OAD69770.1 hypothetical protein PHYBLDRAFT_148959 [Phycomyces blakesleeanus NRRL 1555(-)]|eukprot:XP_018287810.1 hypothetical protein PHYBLDRAFT_148959 [Phycomyces blakesleeanus NRRL 1555(-)]